MYTRYKTIPVLLALQVCVEKHNMMLRLKLINIFWVINSNTAYQKLIKQKN